jgi:hypothetical protein
VSSGKPALDRLPSSGQKLVWAQVHLDALKKRIEIFGKGNPVEITSHFKAKRPGYDTVFHIRQNTPPEIVLGVGDVIGNMRDALDHLVWELTVAYTGHPLKWTAWPIVWQRIDWPLKGKSGKPNNRSGEYKIRGIDPKLWPEVKRLQPFYRKRKEDPSPKHILWVLDELRNLDRHRRIAVVPVTVTETKTSVELRDRSVPQPVRYYLRARPPKDGSVIERWRIPSGFSESEVRITSEATQVGMALDEPTAHQRYTNLVGTLEELRRAVFYVLRRFAQLTG